MASQQEPRAAGPRYRERLRAPWWMWLLAAGFALAIGVAFGYALGAPIGLLAAAAVALAAGTLLVSLTVTIAVDDRQLWVGRAHLPLQFTGTLTPLVGESATRARGIDFDPRDHVMLRTWATGSLLAIELTDDRDPHPRWLVSTRDPAGLADIIASSRADVAASWSSAPQSGKVGDATVPAEEGP